VGFDPAAPSCQQGDAGFGLFSVRERLRDLGGHMTVTAAPGAGCVVVLEVPIEPRGGP
jgi:signal transduction histidine kinase